MLKRSDPLKVVASWTLGAKCFVLHPVEGYRKILWAKSFVQRGRNIDGSARPREYLTEREIEKLIEAAKANRWGHQDATAILLAYRHGLRASELVALRWAGCTAG